MGKPWNSGWALVVVASVLLLAGCHRQDTERLAKIGSLLGERAERAVDTVKADCADDWQALDNRYQQRETVRRVSARLRGDQSLADAHIELIAQGDVIELRGQVKDLVQKRRAVELAETTVGVTRVADHLRLPN